MTLSPLCPGTCDRSYPSFPLLVENQAAVQTHLRHRCADKTDLLARRRRAQDSSCTRMLRYSPAHTKKTTRKLQDLWDRNGYIMRRMGHHASVTTRTKKTYDKNVGECRCADAAHTRGPGGVSPCYMMILGSGTLSLSSLWGSTMAPLSSSSSLVDTSSPRMLEFSTRAQRPILEYQPTIDEQTYAWLLICSADGRGNSRALGSR